MKNIILAFLSGIFLCMITYYIYNNKNHEISSQIRDELLGYTSYRDYITKSKTTLSKQSKFLAVIATREEGYTRKIDKKQYIFSSDANVAITYKAKYSFGYDLSSSNYDIIDSPSGIEIILQSKPTLLVEPAIISKNYYINDTGWLIDEKLALLEIYKGIDKVALIEGHKLAKSDGVVALCEKQLIAFVRDFLLKQKGVKSVPFISISYKK